MLEELKAVLTASQKVVTTATNLVSAMNTLSGAETNVKTLRVAFEAALVEERSAITVLERSRNMGHSTRTLGREVEV